MSDYTISIVLLIPAAYQTEINALAESLGWGPDSLSVPLVHTDGSTWFGCHTWATIEFLEMVEEQPPSDVMAALVMSVIEGGDPLGHWNEALEANGLARA